jgi:hypothetical protein
MLDQRFFWVRAIPNGPDRMAVKTSATSMRRRRLLPRWPLVYQVVFESWNISTRSTNAGRSGLNEGGRQWMGNGPPELTVKSTAAQILGASSACSRFDKQPLVIKFEISIEALPGMCTAKGYAACAYQKRKRSNASVSYEPHHKHRSAPFSFFPPAEVIFRCG